MSGFEIAGVVLGSIPLVINSLEHYSGGVDTIRQMIGYQYVFEDLHSSFLASQAIYLNSCYLLLEPLTLPDNKMQDLIGEGNKEQKRVAWSDPNLHSKLQGRLGTNSVPYVSLVRQLNKRITLFAKKLGLQEDLRPPWLGKDGSVDEKARKRVFGTWNRIKGGFQAEKYAKLLAEIDRDVYKISKLTSGTIQLEPMHAKRKKRLNSAYCSRIRTQAEKLFDAFSARWGGSCACQSSHCVHLRLDLRQEDIPAQGTRMAFLFSFDKAGIMHTSLPWDWQDIEVETLQPADTTISVATPSSQSTQTKVRFGNLPSIKTTAPPKDSHSSLQINPPNQSSCSSPSHPSPLSHHNIPTQIDNLCKALMKKERAAHCLGFLEDNSWKHYVYVASGPAASNEIAGAESLRDLVNKKHGSCISVKNKCILALTLASALLQLYDTPWLGSSWSASDIYFPKTKQGLLLVAHPYVSRTFSSQKQSIKKDTSQMKRRLLVKNELVFALGVALLELSWGQSISALAEPDDLDENGKTNSITEILIANRLASSIHDRELQNYATAVFKCVNCNFGTTSYDLDNNTFREKFCENVIVPLQEDYDHAVGNKI